MYQTKDPIQQLTDYIKKNIAKGYTPDSLKFSLMSQGYSRISVERAIDIAHKQLADSLPPLREKPQITYKIITDEEPLKVSKKKGFFKRLFGL